MPQHAGRTRSVAISRHRNRDDISDRACSSAHAPSRRNRSGTRMLVALRRLAVMVVVLAALLIPRPTSLLETEVRHGESPNWSGPAYGRYAVTVVGYYRDSPNLVRAGVRKVEWQAEAKAKRRAEMLALRA